MVHRRPHTEKKDTAVCVCVCVAGTFCTIIFNDHVEKVEKEKHFFFAFKWVALHACVQLYLCNRQCI